MRQLKFHVSSGNTAKTSFLRNTSCYDFTFFGSGSGRGLHIWDCYLSFYNMGKWDWTFVVGNLKVNLHWHKFILDVHFKHVIGNFSIFFFGIGIFDYFSGIFVLGLWTPQEDPLLIMSSFSTRFTMNWPTL